MGLMGLMDPMSPISPIGAEPAWEALGSSANPRFGRQAQWGQAMRKGWSRRKLVLVLALTAILLYVGFAVWIPNYPLRPSDKEEATQHLVAWVAEGKSLSAFHEAYPEAERMTSMKQIFVMCDFLPPGVILGSDPRVQRLAAANYQLTYRKFGYRETSYLTLELKEDTAETLILEVFNVSGPLNGHQYRFVVNRKLFGLRLTGQFLGILRRKRGCHLIDKFTSIEPRPFSMVGR